LLLLSTVSCLLHTLQRYHFYRRTFFLAKPTWVLTPLFPVFELKDKDKDKDKDEDKDKYKV
jgi:hypothetical protein